jgi:hypothetical protein
MSPFDRTQMSPFECYTTSPLLKLEGRRDNLAFEAMRLPPLGKQEIA